MDLGRGRGQALGCALPLLRGDSGSSLLFRHHARLPVSGGFSLSLGELEARAKAKRTYFVQKNYSKESSAFS